MAVKRLPPQAVDAYLRHRHSCLSAALLDAGVGQDRMNAETLSSGVIGRIARRWAMTPEQFVTAVEQFGKP